AWLKVHDSSEQARAQAESWLRGFEPQLREAGLGQLSEVADAEPPHTPGGCFAQAWSVAEVLRSLCDDVLHVTR
ncbi:MAG TPA: amylo-alpha-1,6-glucosidase, partial [Bryobacteraceae bacterium]|nr:amylo-alpha-1,6-glucosidase [Bryobacteraceae bacterium]